MKFTTVTSRLILVALFAAAVCVRADETPTVTVKGYVLDSACAFTKGLAKPISKQCATSCAKAGSPLVILSEDGTIYWPIAGTTPSSGQNGKLLPYAGGKVTATGRVYERGGSKAIVIEKIEAQTGANGRGPAARGTLSWSGAAFYPWRAGQAKFAFRSGFTSTGLSLVKMPSALKLKTV